MAGKRDKIRYCLDDYLTHLPEEKKSAYLLENTALITIVHAADSDEKIMSDAKKYDEENGTDIFSEVIKYRVYCIACHKIDCDC